MAVSHVNELTDGRFEPVLLDVATSDEVKRVIITSGKVYYDLRQARDKANAKVAILRLEQFYPFPMTQLDSRRTWLQPGRKAFINVDGRRPSA